MKLAIFTNALHEIEQTTLRTRITAILSDLLGRASPDEASSITYMLQGRVAPLFAPVEFGVAVKNMVKAISHAYGVGEDDVTAMFKKTGDIGAAAQALAPGAATGDMTVQELYQALLRITQASGAGSQTVKVGLMSDILKKCDGLSARYAARIPVGVLRLGCSDMTILDALSVLLAGDKSLRARLEAAYSMYPDIGSITRWVKKDGIDGLKSVRVTVGTPVLSSLSQRLPGADEMIEKMGEVAVEPKYDGVRVQIHWKASGGGPSVHSFSRNLEETTAMFPELSRIGAQLAAQSVILDSEAVGIDPAEDRIVSFQETSVRKRKHGVKEAAGTLPVRFYVFDILEKDGVSLLEQPLSQRRHILEETVHAGDVLAISPQIVTKDPEEIRAYHKAQLARGLEGVMVKRWSGIYEPGRTGYSWVKFKADEGRTGKLTDTIDTVVMGYYLGEGKRTQLGIGALLVGIRDGERFTSITKIGTGVSDELWRTLKTRLAPAQSATCPREYAPVDTTLTPDVWVRPELVVEVAGDDLTKSSTHATEYAIRFPRLVKVRDDKNPENVTTKEEVASMYRLQGKENA